MKRIGDFITREEEIFGLPAGEYKNSYSVIPAMRKYRGPTTVSIAYIDESGTILFWVAKDILKNAAIEWVKDHGKPWDWDPDDEC